MSLGFYFDHHVDAAIERGLRRRGIDVLTCKADGTTTWDDDRLLERATQLGRILFSQDRDLLVIASSAQRRGLSFAGLVYGDAPRLTVGQCVDDLELIAQVYDADSMKDRIEFIPL